MLSKQVAQSAPVAVPDNCRSHRFEPQAADADWNNGLTVDITTTFFVGGNPVWQNITRGVRPVLLLDGVTVEPPHTSFHFPADPKSGLPVFDQASLIPIVGASTVVKCVPSMAASVGIRQCAAPVAAQLPAPLPAPVLTQVGPVITGGL